jgi:hypothetical protein
MSGSGRVFETDEATTRQDSPRERFENDLLDQHGGRVGVSWRLAGWYQGLEMAATGSSLAWTSTITRIALVARPRSSGGLDRRTSTWPSRARSRTSSAFVLA